MLQANQFSPICLICLQFVPVRIAHPCRLLVRILIQTLVSVQGWPQGRRDRTYLGSLRRCHPDTGAERAQDPSRCAWRLWPQGRVCAGELFVVRGRGRGHGSFRGLRRLVCLSIYLSSWHHACTYLLLVIYNWNMCGHYKRQMLSNLKP